MSAKHTHGPWKYEVSQNVFPSQVLFVEEGEIGPAVISSYKQHTKGNGTLIAAAPDMLAMLKTLSFQLGELSLDVTAIDELIKKVEG